MLVQDFVRSETELVGLIGLTSQSQQMGVQTWC
jgi:hypothetical protein